MAQLSEWLQIMLEEIARKHEEARRAAEEAQRRHAAPAVAKAAEAATVPERIAAL